MSIFKITCDEATTICDKSQYGKATLVELIKLKLHFFTCKICMLYTKQNTLMSKMLKHSKAEKSICRLSEKEKQELRDALQNQK